MLHLLYYHHWGLQQGASYELEHNLEVPQGSNFQLSPHGN